MSYPNIIFKIMTSKLNPKRLNRPPEGEPWIWHTREMLSSEAFRALGINERRILDFIILEHLAHAGTENGNLKAPYNHLTEFGASRRLIKKAIDKLELMGFIDVVRGGRILSEDKCSVYRLTWLPDKDGNPPTNRWKFVSTQLREKQNPTPNSETDKDP